MLFFRFFKNVFDLRCEAKEWLMKEREVGQGGFVKDLFDMFLLGSKLSVLLKTDQLLSFDP